MPSTLSKLKILILTSDSRVKGVIEAAPEVLPDAVISTENRFNEIASTIAAAAPDLILFDLTVQGKSTLSLVKQYCFRDHLPQIICLADPPLAPTALDTMRKGAFSYLIKPFSLEQLRSQVKPARDYVESLKLSEPDPSLDSLRDSPEYLKGNSPKMRQVMSIVRELSGTEYSVLLEGESGSGKELIAQMLHQKSQRAGKPFVAVNCAALPDTLVESELFGYERGAFTGANRRHLGKFEQAHQGTLFLDEIGDMGFTAQSRLLRALQEQEIYRLGGNEVIQVNVRVIAATNQNLSAAIKAGRFREDLYYRLSVFPLKIPPLRQRQEDIVPLLMAFLRRFHQPGQSTVKTIAPRAKRVLEAYYWPGNVRELQNVARRILINLEGSLIDLAALPPEIRENETQVALNGVGNVQEPITLAEMEKAAIIRALRYSGNNFSQTAVLLGIGRSTLYRKLEHYNIQTPKPSRNGITVFKKRF